MIANLIWSRSHFCIIFGAHKSILFIVKVKIFVDIKWPYRSSPIMLTVEPKMVNISFWARTPMSIKHMMFFWCLFVHPHLTPHHSNVAVWLKKSDHERPAFFNPLLRISTKRFLTASHALTSLMYQQLTLIVLDMWFGSQQRNFMDVVWSVQVRPSGNGIELFTCHQGKFSFCKGSSGRNSSYSRRFLRFCTILSMQQTLSWKVSTYIYYVHKTYMVHLIPSWKIGSLFE